MEASPADISALLDAFNNGRMAEAEERAAAMTISHPDTGMGWRVLGTILAQQGKVREALIPLQRAAEFFPGSAETQNNLGAVLQRLDRFAEAEQHFRRAVALKPDYAEAHNNLGTALMKQSQVAEAETSFRQAIALRPSYAEAHCNLGILLCEMSRLAEAEASYRAAVNLDPGDARMHQKLIFMMDLTSGDAGLQHAERKRWAQRFAPARPGAPLTNSPDPGRRLRIGYLSGDFWLHPAAMSFGAMLISFDAANFEVFAYSNSLVSDDLTARFQRSVPNWRNITGLSDDAVAAQIRADAIDILVDLSGHSFGSRLQVLARKPAPVQITAWGYLSGTGLDSVDAIFSDPVLIPEHEKCFYEEQVRYLPCAVSVLWPRELPATSALPAASNGTVTFGSFNRLSKVSDEALAAWARVLHAVPGSRFLLKAREIAYPLTADRVLRKFADADIGPERIVLMGRTSWHDHMRAHDGVDIALDSFPQSGGVTTLEGLAMGVPVVTLNWSTITGRLSASILTALGMTDWIASTLDEYLEIAVRKAGNLRELAALRQGLRARLDASIISRHEAYVAAVEQEYRALWKEWCERQSQR